MNTTYTLNLLKNSVDTLKYDRLLEKASTNPALRISKRKFLTSFDRQIRTFLNYADKQTWENPSTLNMAVVGLSSYQFALLAECISDLEGNPTVQDVFVALSFRYLRQCFDTPDAEGVSFQKDIPLVYNFTFGNTQEGSYQGRKRNELLSPKTPSSLIYRVQDKEVIRLNENDNIYSQSDFYGDASFPAKTLFPENGQDFLPEYTTDFYGNPSSAEISQIVTKAAERVGEFLNLDADFEFNIDREKQKTILQACQNLLRYKVRNESLKEQYVPSSVDFQDNKANQLCVTISQGTSDDPQNSINIPLSGFTAMLQVAESLNRETFKVKTLGERAIIDFSFVEETQKTDWVQEDGKAVKKERTEFTILPAFYEFDGKSCTTTISAVFFSEEPDFQIEAERIQETAVEVEPLTSLPINLLRRSVFKNKRPIVVDSLVEWSRVTSNFYDNALSLAESYVNRYTNIKKQKATGKIIRKFDQDIFDNKKSLLESLSNVDYAQRIDSYVWSVEEKFWDLNPNFTIEKTLQYFLGMGLGRTNENQDSNAYRLLCARILGIDYFQHYEELVKGAMQAENSSLYIDIEKLKPVADNEIVNFDASLVRCEAEFVRTNLYRLEERLVKGDGKEYFQALGLDAESQTERHLNCIAKYKAQTARFFFEKSVNDYELLVKNKGLGKAYLPVKDESEYSVENTDNSSKISNADYERRRIVLPQQFVSSNNSFVGNEFLPEDFEWGAKNKEYPNLTGLTLIGLLYTQQVPELTAKIQMYRAGVPLSNSDGGATENVVTEFVQMSLKEFDGYTSTGKPRKQQKSSQFVNPDSPKTAGGTYNLGSLPTKKSLWKFAEPYLWENYGVMLRELRELDLIGEDDSYIPENVGQIILDRMDSEYNKLNSRTQLIGDESRTLSAILRGSASEFEKKFNQTYNNAPDKAKQNFGETPIFLEYSRLFSKNKAIFNLRPAQLKGLRFLSANGNNGILAHEVGFGKTTSSIAKISDLFLRGEASRVLVIAPTEEVYNKWFDEIKGKEGALGVLGLNANVIGLGNLEFDALRGKATGDDFIKKQKFGEFDGAFEYSKVQVEFIKKAGEIGAEVLKELGGRGQRLKNWTSASALQQVDILPSESFVSRDGFDKPPRPVKWFGKEKLKWDKDRVVTFNEPSGIYYDFVNDSVSERSASTTFRLGTISDLKSAKNNNTFLELLFRTAKKYVPQIEVEDLSMLWTYLQEIEVRYRSISRDRLNASAFFRSYSPIFTIKGKAVDLPTPPSKVNYISSFEPRRSESTRSGTSGEYGGNNKRNIIDNIQQGLAAYSFMLAAHIATEGAVKRPNTPSNVGAYQFLPHIRKSITSMKPKDVRDKFFAGNSVSSILNGNAAFVAPVFDDFLNRFNGLREYYDPMTERTAIRFYVNDKEIYKGMTLANLESSQELQMTSEIAEVMNQLKRISVCVGELKKVSREPQTVFVALKTAVGKFKMPYEYSLKAATVMNDFPDEDIVLTKTGKKFSVQKLGLEGNPAYFKNSTISALASNQLNGISISRFAFDAAITDEVHNFNRGFKKPTNLVFKNIDSSQLEKIMGINAPLRTTVSRQKEIAVQTFSAEAKYNIRSDVQNFGALCFMISDISDRKYSTPNRKVNNNIFLSATPFTDDNFQAYTLFRFINSQLLNQLGIDSLAKFYRLFANELFKIDINIRGNVGLFPVIDGYKNTYVLSRIIGSFSDFAVSDVEIDKRRPKKIIIANNVSYPSNAGVSSENFDKVISEIKDAKLNSFVPKNDAQKKMAQDASDYIVGKIDIPLRASRSEINAGNDIYADILNWKQSSGYNDKSSEELKKILKSLDDLFTKKKVEREGVKQEKLVLTNDIDGEKVEELLDQGFEIDSTNLDLRKYAISYESSEDDDLDIDDFDLEGSSGITGTSNAQQIASRTMQMAGVSALTLLSPYFVTTDKQGARFKKGDNPYLPPLNFKDKKGNYQFNSYENAKTFVDNSPKIKYTCEAIAQQIRYQKDRGEKVSGSIVYSQFFQFTYHGHRWRLFDLMSIYLLGTHPDLFEEDYLGDSTEKLTFDEKRAKFFVQIVGSEKAKNQVDQFNSGEAYVLFGTERIKEGVDLQKNSSFLYILTIGYVPVTFMQLHGRMWRQGNPFKYCFIVNVLVKNSIDAFQYSKLDQKINAVRNMLESGVYDANETQFDVDVNEIKLNLINDAEKLAELEYEEIKDSLATKVKTMQNQVETLDLIETKLDSVLPKYKINAPKVAEVWNEFSQVYLLLLSISKQESVNNTAFNSAKNDLAEKLFDEQFTDKDKTSEEGKKEYEQAYGKYLVLKDEQSKMTTAQWTEAQKRKKWKEYLKISTESEIQRGLSNIDPEVVQKAKEYGLMSLDEAKAATLSDPRFKNLNSPVRPDKDGYIPYAVYDELQENLDKLTTKFLSGEGNVKFIEDYNSWMTLAMEYKSGKVKQEDLVKSYIGNRPAVYNALYITYILIPLVDEVSGGYNLQEIDTNAYLARYTRLVTGQQTTFMGTQAYQRVEDYDAIPARKAAKRVQEFIDEIINDRTASRVLQGFERLMKGKGENGSDLKVDDVADLKKKFEGQIAIDNEQLINPAKTKSELAQKFQKKLDEIANQKDEDLNEKIKELAMVYPLIQRKQE